MKPKTRQQIEVYTMSQALPRMDNEVSKWAFDTCIDHIGFRTKKNGISCLSCGHVWKGDKTATEEICPACKRKLKVETTRKKKAAQLIYCAVINTIGNYQL